ncbi:MAG: gliding motility-associated ABC transporter substrate-binding protein GldG [Prolixibacteraceae bacterium]|nr:gliding motility-associated ABC transporter substrate-binding protein GldG [Prolixibacteraceae bacterium]
MFSLFKKELNAFFGSITGFLVVSIFLLTTSLFLWVIPGPFNLIDGQRASLKIFFDLAPWLYLFLIPAITMRMFAEERKMGTLEMIVTRPISTIGIVLSKFMAALILVVVSLLPTLLYFYSVFQLGNPAGNIDTGATWGSYTGLVLLAAGYIAIGLFASMLTSNQVIAFLLAVVISFIMFLGLDFIASAGIPNALQNILLQFSIHEHYLSISRGVIDSRDLSYFLLLTLFFLALTTRFINKLSITAILSQTRFIGLLLVSILFVAMTQIRLFRIDLTAENRYTLSAVSKSILDDWSKPIDVDIYLAGNLPSGMKEFQDAIVEKVEDMNAFSNERIRAEIRDVYEISNETERKRIITSLVEAGIEPVNFGHKTTEGLSTRQIFPGAIIRTGNKAIAINLLKNNPLLSADENLQQSIELLEFEFIRALRYLQQESPKTIAFLSGHGEASNFETGDLRYNLSEQYQIIDIRAEALSDKDSIQVLVVAAPGEALNESDKLHIDQFIMQGGNVLWCIDPVQVSIDSLSKGLSTIAFEKGLNLRDQLFRYGVRLNPNLIQDAFCMEYPVNTAPPGQASSFTPAPFYYAPLALPRPEHPLSRNLNNVMLEFASSVQLVGESEEVKGTVILSTSPYARSMQTPLEVSLLSATNPPDQQLFNQANIPIGVLLEGNFSSAFTNRMTGQLGFSQIRDKGAPSKMIVIADGDILKNKVRNRGGQVQIQALGFDQYSGQVFGNREFLMNCIDYLADDQGIMQLRTKVVKLRLLDKVKIRDQQLRWQLINILLPVLIYLLMGILYNYIRQRRYR